MLILVGGVWVGFLKGVAIDHHAHVVGITRGDVFWIGHAEAVAPHVEGADLRVFILQDLIAYKDLSRQCHGAVILTFIDSPFRRIAHHDEVQPA